MQPGGLERVAQLLEDMGGGLVHESRHELEPISAEIARRSGVMDTLLWVQKIVTAQLERVGRYEDPRPLQDLLAQVQDEIRAQGGGSPVAVA